jgi:hypothetical protein
MLSLSDLDIGSVKPEQISSENADIDDEFSNQTL